VPKTLQRKNIRNLLKSLGKKDLQIVGTGIAQAKIVQSIYIKRKTSMKSICYVLDKIVQRWAKMSND
jgi:hypothetical protein